MSHSTFLAVHLLRPHAIKRWPLMHSEREESLSSHIADTCLLGHLLAAVACDIHERTDIDPGEVASLCLLHEIAESGGCGDINSRCKHHNKETYEAIKALESIFEGMALDMLPEQLKARYTPLFKQDKNDINAKVAKIADTFAALIKCQWEISHGNAVDFKDALESIEQQIEVYAEHYDFVRTFIELFLSEDITRITVDKQNSDWVKNTDAGS